MDIKPKLTPRQEYALLRISEIIKETQQHQKTKIPCYIKLIICAVILISGVVFMPYQLQEYIHVFNAEINAAPHSYTKTKDINDDAHQLNTFSHTYNWLY